MQTTILGIDLAKNVFQLHGVDDQGKVVGRKKVTRPQLLPFVAQLAPCRIGMEACQGAHSWARAMRKLGHDVRLISPQCVTPYRQSHTNDPNDGEQGDAGDYGATPVQWPGSFIRHLNPEKRPYACQTSARPVQR